MGHSLRNVFCSRVKFLLQSHDKNERLSLRHSHLCGFHPRSHRHAPHAPFVIFNLEQVFSLHDTRMSISFGLKTGMNSFRNDLYTNEMLFLHHVNKYREIYRDGMILFQNESHSGIM